MRASRVVGVLLLCTVSARAAPDDATVKTIKDYVDQRYYPTIVTGIEFSAAKLDIDHPEPLVFGEWKLDPGTNAFLYATYDSGNPTFVKITGFTCSKTGAAPFPCSLAMTANKVCAVLSEPNGETGFRIGCPESLDLIYPPLPS